MIDRPTGGERVLLVHVKFPTSKLEEDIGEFKELAASAGADIIDVMVTAKHEPEPKYFIGSGKAEEIRDAVALHKIELVIFNHVLTPAQERNLERLIQCRVIDRTGLILDIFAQRARSFEGQLQVELAFLSHMSTRLVRGWTHLERQKGGIGLRGGPGETQLEVDRRLIRNKIKVIKERLAKIRKQREQGRRSRRRATVPTVALVGYTNAGKSTLFNLLTGGDVYVANQLFATLDPTLRRVDIPHIGTIILADTVGFIRHLPHDLVEAFHGTLEEVSEANLLLHVVDASDEQKAEHIEQVSAVLKTIEADKVPRLQVHNKIDLCPHLQPKVERDEFGLIRRVFISAEKNLGIEALRSCIAEMLHQAFIEQVVVLQPAQASLRARLYELRAVLSEEVDEEGCFHIRVRLPQVEFERLFR
jgi:GTP-binding protein HflX